MSEYRQHLFPPLGSRVIVRRGEWFAIATVVGPGKKAGVRVRFNDGQDNLVVNNLHEDFAPEELEPAE